MFYTLVNKYYSDNEVLRDLLMKHSSDVAHKAIAIAKVHPEWQIDMQFLEEAAMLHDIGVFLTDAPCIHCYGTEPYIRHGVLGAEILRKEGLPQHARVAERHTGAGITAEDICSQGLPLPEQDFLPETIEEKIICYADKFFSKSKPEAEKPLERVLLSMTKFGEGTVKRFSELHEMFL